MGSLKDFIAEKAEELRSEEPRIARKRDEWVAAVDRLVEQIRGWLEEADPDRHVLDIQDHTYQLREAGIGAYEVRGLMVGVGPSEIRVEPIARNVVGPLAQTGFLHMTQPYGRVDLTDGLRRFMIFRQEKEPEDRWVIIEQDGFRMQDFDRTAFEAAFKSLLE